MDGVVFDLDGTLLDTLDDIHEVVNRVFRSADLPEPTREEVRFAVGRGVEHLVEKLLPEYRSDEGQLSFLAGRIREVYLEMGSVMTRPYSGIPELLRELDRRGYPMAVLTNKPQASADESVERYFGGVRFLMVRGAVEGFPLKPSPEVSIPVIRALGYPAERIMMVGDSDVDIDTAVNAGMRAVGVSWGFRDAVLLRARGALSIIHRPDELLELLKRADSLSEVGSRVPEGEER